MSKEKVVSKIETGIRDVKTLIISSTEKFSERDAFFVKEKSKKDEFIGISYKKFREDLISLSNSLLVFNLSKERIGVIGDNSYQWVLAYFASIFIGAIVVPLDKELNEEEITNLSKRSNLKAIFYTDKHKNEIENQDIKYKIRIKKYFNEESKTEIVKGGIEFKELIKEYKNEDEKSVLDIKIDPNDLVVIMFTSGTTGEAKGVCLTSENLALNIYDMQDRLCLREGDRTLSMLPMHHCFEARMGITLMLSIGASIYIGDGLKEIYTNLKESRPNAIACVPLLLGNFFKRVFRDAEKDGSLPTLEKNISEYKLLRKKMYHGKCFDDEKLRIEGKKLFKRWHDLFGGEIRQIFTGAAAIDPKIIEGLSDIGIKILQGYGMTEMSALLASQSYEADEYFNSSSVGKPVKSTEVKIIDKDKDGIGEIVAKGKIMMQGYLDNEEKTNEVIKNGYYHTGDYGYFDDEGELYITGRKTNMIVTATGKNIFPEEIELPLSKNKFIDELMVFGAIDKKRETVYVSIQIIPNKELIKKETNKDDKETVFNFIKNIILQYNDTLPNYKRIRGLIIREEGFIKTPTGKIKRAKNIDVNPLKSYHSRF